ncbi:hypothetical protein A2707_01970 [Candidatus Saccharibacteria bacterium RIFCSPHIGHO2_01_FULL_45_15]|nr:MAG: hypothetical protein A2707_01970 [Candidatus Saccharibacteria bacterium RIFCSPHIGHO2_01_FULL_45_15]OGL27763.1 MAG: hypothetical protein A3C39_04220 [Candidatus Saccharibacteria bacterium RIFCSPHIGHO2_02_FULL_46_12]OGL31652.1 MAG: hypothetical protein A3E76_00870 [Candidatus Saccharibacteria bacterium RIFCSPHIGHO2_12_FULL_44_22]
MATKKAGSTAKKKTTTVTRIKSTDTAAKPSTKVVKTDADVPAKVTTVKAVDSEKPTSAKGARFTNKTFIASALIGEFIGAFLFTVAFLAIKGDPLYVGLALAGIVLIVGTISGAHINPAVTVGAWVTRKMTTLRALGYIIAQVLGAALAFVALNMFLNSVAQPNAQEAAMTGQTVAEVYKAKVLTESNQWYVFFAELIAAAIFVFAFAGARLEKDRLAKAFTVGLGFLVAAMFGYIATAYVDATTIFNPATALALQAIDWSKIEIVTLAAYLVAPLIGGVIGFGLRDVLRGTEDKNA